MNIEVNIQEDTQETTPFSYQQQRLQRMREEKEKQQRRRKLIKQYAPYVGASILAIVLIVVLTLIVVRAINNRKEEKALQGKELETNQTIGDYDILSSIPQQEPEMTVEKPKPVHIDGMPPIVVTASDMMQGYSVDTSGATSAVSQDDVQSQFATLVNATSGKVLVSINGTDRMNPASMTKVMTVLVACEHITDLDMSCEVLLEDTDYAYIRGLSIAGFEAGEIVPLRDILYGAIMPSGGECCHVIERVVAGDEETFIQMMNDKARELGLVNTHYVNSAGSYDPNHYTTAVEMSMVMKAAIENDLCRQILHEHSYTTSPTEQHPEGLQIDNWFLRRIEDKYYTTEVLGAKTGFVSKAGSCAVSYTVTDDGEVYICTTGNAHSSWRAIYDHVSLYDMYITDKQAGN